ncbi:YwqJ-related putative deaminase [Streptomyces apocyni]|uniref:YwqJ-related putative deaminase n=1 Tax=Streptomyces apocyni TaxID=2654677 RepID=UPI0012EA5484|nr:YwqJ-related putative deaminase [Streptomyces apocyni]
MYTAHHPHTGDPRLSWSAKATATAAATATATATGFDAPPPPVLHQRRDGILPTVAAALSVRGDTLTGTAARSDTAPALHPLVQDFLDTLTTAQRERFTGRCPETILISRRLTAYETGRSKRAQRKPLAVGEARKALKHAKLTARRIREDGDPLHGTFAPPCRSCTALADHFGVHIVDPTGNGSQN